MQVALGRKGDYALRAVLELARSYGTGRRKTREIATEMDIPGSYLPQILAELVRAGLLTAQAGPDGGYSLARPPAQITLLEVVEIAEGEVGLAQCVIRGGPCDWERACPVHEPWARAQAAVRRELGATTFADLVATDRAIREQHYLPPNAGHLLPTPRRAGRSRPH